MRHGEHQQVALIKDVIGGQVNAVDPAVTIGDHGTLVLDRVGDRDFLAADGLGIGLHTRHYQVSWWCVEHGDRDGIKVVAVDVIRSVWIEILRELGFRYALATIGPDCNVVLARGLVGQADDDLILIKLARCQRIRIAEAADEAVAAGRVWSIGFKCKPHLIGPGRRASWSRAAVLDRVAHDDVAVVERLHRCGQRGQYQVWWRDGFGIDVDAESGIESVAVVVVVEFDHPTVAIGHDDNEEIALHVVGNAERRRG